MSFTALRCVIREIELLKSSLVLVPDSIIQTSLFPDSGPLELNRGIMNDITVTCR